MAKKFYITTSIAYTNAPPHIGFALELVQADVIARYNRLLKKDVFFLTGTDEHGAKIAKAAEDNGKNPREFVDEISEKFKKLAEILNVSNNDFIRTTDRRKHWPAVEKVWLELLKKGDIYKKNYQGLYCVGCEAFITKKDLIDGKCAIHQTIPEIVEEENYFFKLSRYSKNVKKAVESDKIKIIPESRKNEMLSFIAQGLEDVSFSRPSKDLKWGIPVPNDSSQTVYVWADALTNYLSAIDYENEASKFKKYWPADIHFIGKDIQKFHIAIWPGMLLALGLKLPPKIFVHGFITSDGQKMSKSLGNVVNPFELVEKYGTDVVRYFLLAEIPPTEDGDFTIKRFEERYNSDLASGIGNLVSRVRAMAEKKFQIPNPLDAKRTPRRAASQINPKSKIQNPKLKKQIKETQKKYKKTLEDFKFNEALKAIWELIKFSDKYINDKKPWETGDAAVISDLLIILREIAKLLSPFLPETSEKILKGTGKPLFPRWALD